MTFLPNNSEEGYSEVRNIGNTRMLEEGSHQGGPATDLRQLPGHARLKGFALLQRPSGLAGPFRVAPDPPRSRGVFGPL